MNYNITEINKLHTVKIERLQAHMEHSIKFINMGTKNKSRNNIDSVTITTAS